MAEERNVFGFRGEKSESVTETERFIQELKEASVTIHNQGKWMHRIDDMTRSVETQISQLTFDYSGLMKELIEYQSRDDIKRNMASNNVVPLAMYRLLQTAFQKQRDIISWKYMQWFMLDEMHKKVKDIIAEASVLDTKKVVLEQMEEMERRRNEMHLKSMESVKQSVDKNIIEGMKVLQSENKLDRKENMLLMKELIENITSLNLGLVRELANNQMIEKNRSENYERRISDDQKHTISKIQSKDLGLSMEPTLVANAKETDAILEQAKREMKAQPKQQQKKEVVESDDFPDIDL